MIPTESEQTDSAQPDVLVVDEGLFFAVRIEKALERLGYRVRVVTRADAAIEQVRDAKPDLVIVDFGSAGLSPAELVARIKSLADPPRVLGFVSHKMLPELRPLAEAAGCDVLVANSAISMRLPDLVADLVPRHGSDERVTQPIAGPAGWTERSAG